MVKKIVLTDDVIEFLACIKNKVVDLGICGVGNDPLVLFEELGKTFGQVRQRQYLLGFG